MVIQALVEHGLTTVDEINRSMKKTFSSLRVDKRNQPKDIKETTTRPGHKKVKFSMSSSQVWAFFRYLPLSIRNIIPFNDHWQLLLYLEEIVDLVMASTFYDSTLVYYEHLYFDFLSLFKLLFPDCSIIPKLHFGLHFPSIVRKNGPPKHFWAMAFERKNGQIKRPSHCMNNFQNPLLTLCNRIQGHALYSQLYSGLLYDRVSIYSSHEILLEDYPHLDLEPYLLHHDQLTIDVTDYVIVKGTEYRKGYFVIIEMAERGYLFGKIVTIICDNPNVPILMLNVFITCDFDYHSFSYRVSQKSPSETKFCRIEELIDFHPLDSVRNSTGTFIRLKYKVN